MKPRSKTLLTIGLIAAVISAAAIYDHYRNGRAHRPALSLPGQIYHLDDELAAGKVYTINDEQGSFVTMISRRVQPGNEIITHEGKHYRVVKVNAGEATAVARYIGLDQDLLAYNEFYSRPELAATAAAQSKRPVAIYHTHSDESYLPTDGKISIPFHGGIIDVGSTFAENLTANGTRVLHDKTPHDPHDNNAYYRSRRTAAALLQEAPLAMFDVHRDGIDDPGIFRRNISNRQVAQMRLVVGRQNPNMSANLDFAKRLMSYANQVHWPVVKDIFISSGNFNQDLLSTALLIEAGTYTNRKEEAMGGVTQLADAVPVVLGITGGPAAGQGSAWTAVLRLLLIVLAGGGAYLLISAGSFSKAKERLSGLFTRELGDVLGPLAKKILPRKRDKK
jgi:stage II sporulation protein P